MTRSGGDFDRMSDVNVRGPVLQLARLIPC
jgi:hypothetical protein